uniref:Uncharacterized protein n=1 Tax=Candidatus Kentrum sp. LFY TaxID=2126342 RepID=A0A450UPF3_9GAMM|nr:MAG: hypothetical protein BECKLFY1418B_GA0070995_10585 [Candidatus Kentron sp. LFY]
MGSISLFIRILNGYIKIRSPLCGPFGPKNRSSRTIPWKIFGELRQPSSNTTQRPCRASHRGLRLWQNPLHGFGTAFHVPEKRSWETRRRNPSPSRLGSGAKR